MVDKAKSEQPKERSEWPWGAGQTVLIAALAFFGSQIILGFVIALTAVIRGVDASELLNDPSYVLEFGASLAIAAISSWIIYKFAKSRKGLDTLGFHKTKLADIGLAFPAYLAYFVTLFVSLAFIRVYIPNANLDQEQTVGFDESSIWAMVAAFVILVVVTPIYEELLFRGFTFRGIAAQTGFWPAAIITSLLFGLAHGQLNVAIDTFILGIASSWLVWNTKSLWPSITLHAIKNLVAFLAVFVFQL